MRKRVLLALLLIASLLSLVWFASSQSTASKSLTKAEPSTIPSMPSKEAVLAKLADLERGWVKNEGQWDERALFSAPGYFGTTWITKDGELLHVAVKKEECKEQTIKAKACPFKSWVISERWVGGKVQTITPEEELQTKVSYFIGNDPSKHKTNLPTYRYVSLGEVWSGIEVKLKATQKTVEKLFYVKPGADPSKIVVQIDGAESLKLSKDGEIIIQTGLGELKLSKPIAWQEKDGKKLPVEVSYKLIGKNRYSFEVAKADPSLPIVIDPILQSTYLGGSRNEYAYALAIHPTTGDVYVAGGTSSNNFPGTTGRGSSRTDEDAFVARLSADLGTLHKSTYLGGGSFDHANCLAIHPTTGDVYVGGRTSSNDFPGTTDRDSDRTDEDAFVARLSADLGTLHKSTYLGGNYEDVARALTIHPTTGDVYVAGWTQSDNFPNTSGGAHGSCSGCPTYFDAFVARLSADLETLHKSTYLGGSRDEYAYALAIHPTTGDVYVVGYTYSDDFPNTSGGAQGSCSGCPTYSDAFVARLSADLETLHKSTYLGGSRDEYAYALAIHPTTGDVYVVGYTYSDDFPNTSGGAQGSCSGCPTYFDAFVARLSADLETLHKSTYLGGNDEEYAYALAIHPTTGDVYVVGYTYSTDFPNTSGGAQGSCSGCPTYSDAFVARLNSSLTQILQSTYLGGSRDEYAHALAIHPTTGDVYVAGGTSSNNFPGTTGRGSSRTDEDAFVARLSVNLTNGPILSISPTPTNGNVASNPTGIYCGSGSSMCSADFINGTSVTLNATADPGYIFEGWGGDCASCGKSTTCTITINANTTCTANFTLATSDGGSGSGGSGTGGGGGGGGCSMTGSASSIAGLWNILVWLSVPAFVVARRIRKK
jgi:uncharacterized repeat protein (TIGR02543 family)